MAPATPGALRSGLTLTDYEFRCAAFTGSQQLPAIRFFASKFSLEPPFEGGLFLHIAKRDQ
jgi:hypothetical protein